MAVRGMACRLVVSSLLFIALAVSGLGWEEVSSETRSVDGALTLTRPPGLTSDAKLASRPDVVSGSWAEPRVPKARVRLGLAVLGGLSALLAAVFVALTRPLPTPGPTHWRRWSVGLRAPPVFRLT